MAAVFAAPRRASKDHLVLDGTSVFWLQEPDAYGFSLMGVRGLPNLPALRLRQSTALQQCSLATVSRARSLGQAGSQGGSLLPRTSAAHAGAVARRRLRSTPGSYTTSYKKRGAVFDWREKILF
jgi:hypothetical protein